MLNRIFVTDDRLKNDADFMEFMQNNPGYSTLKIRASAANEAYPISGVKVVVTRIIGTNEVIFFDGETDSSGMINNIILPSPKAIQNDLEVPQFTEYQVSAIDDNYGYNKTFQVSVCCGITVIQYINITPPVTEERYGN
ncbi:MAG: hypothetical protein IJ193_09715 [Bacilli bacterium]|nr:hypothetical protein [Bacilli bacterium]